MRSACSATSSNLAENPAASSCLTNAQQVADGRPECHRER